MRRSSFAGLLNAMAREAARSKRLAEAEHRRQLRASMQAQRYEERQRAFEDKEAKLRYVEERIAEAQDKTIEAQDRVNELRQILQHTLSVDNTISFGSLKIKEEFPAFSPIPELANPLSPPSNEEFLKDIKPPSRLKKLLPGSQDRASREARLLENRVDAREHQASPLRDEIPHGGDPRGQTHGHGNRASGGCRGLRLDEPRRLEYGRHLGDWTLRSSQRQHRCEGRAHQCTGHRCLPWVRVESAELCGRDDHEQAGR